MYPSFSLQVVLDYRSSLVEALEIELAQLIASLVKAQQVLENLKEKRRQLDIELRDAQLGELDLVHITHIRINIDLVDTYIERQAEEVVKLNQQVEEKRQELVKARQDEEVLEILKEKMIEQFQEEMKIKESRAQDDVYIAGYYQKMLKRAH
jgi:flagellar export protein FliJ